MDRKLEPVVKIEGFSVDYLEENEHWQVIREELQSTSVPAPVPGPGVQRSLNCGSTSTLDTAVITGFHQEIGSDLNSKQIANPPGPDSELQATTIRGVKRGSREENPHAQEVFKCSILNKKMKNEMNVASNSLSTAINEVVQVQDHVVNNEAAKGIQEIVLLTPPKEADSSSQVNRNAEEQNMVIFRCSVCPKKYTTQEALSWHVERNHENVQRSCKLCPIKGFRDRQELVRHIKRSHREFCYCFNCNESFGTKAEFNKHLDSTIINDFTVGLKHDLDSKTNNNEFFTVQLKYKCQMCSATLNSQCEFSSHIKAHAAPGELKS